MYLLNVVILSCCILMIKYCLFLHLCAHKPIIGFKISLRLTHFSHTFFCVQSVEMSVDTFFIDHFPFLHPLTQFSLAISHIDASLHCEEHYIWCTMLRGHMTHTNSDVNIINSTVFFYSRAHLEARELGDYWEGWK